MATRTASANAKDANGLTPKQAAFVREYLIDFNGTQAAIRAGYSARTARVLAQETLLNPAVAAELAKRTAKIAAVSEVTAENVRDELRKIGFSNIRKAVKWRSGVERAVEDSEGLVIRAVVNEVVLVDSDDLDDDTAAAIQSVSQTATGGLTVKMYDKRAALVDLGKHLGMFKDEISFTGDPVTFTIVHTERAKRAS